MNKENKCPCKHINCQRYGRCSDCMKYHRENNSFPTACERIRINKERQKTYKKTVPPVIRHTIHFETPVGILCARADDDALVKLFLDNEMTFPDTHETQLLAEVRKQIDEYFKGKRKEFDIPLNLYGTQFQMNVWKALLTIKYGNTCCYGDIATMCSDSSAARAVGGAVNKNPVLIIVPCHRIISKNGKQTNFAAGVDVKEKLLKVENIK